MPESSTHEISGAVLFADICDSSRLYAALGDAAARRLVLDTLAALRRAAEEHGGRVVDQIGDELMCLLPTAEAAAHAAMEMQTAVRELRAEGALAEPLTIRVGFHHGRVLTDGERIFGDTVYTAHRMAVLARGEQIFTTGESLERLGSGVRPPSRFVDRATVKGKRGSFEVHELIWETDGLTIGPGAQAADPPSAGTLELRHRGELIRLDAEEPVLTVGRGEDRDLMLAHPAVSRHHARIERRAGYFVFADHSTNGSHLLAGTGDWTRVHRDERRLTGSGAIVLGVAPGETGAPRLEYRCGEG